MSEFTYRKAEPTDFPLISETKKRSLLEEGDWDEKTLGAITENFVNTVKRGALTAYLAFCGSEFAGLGAILILREEAALSEFYVLPKYRNMGVMHGLINSLIKEARKHGCERALLIVKEEHRAHWQARGFRDLFEENDDGETFLSQRMEMLLN